MENFQKYKIENNKEKRIMEDLYCSKSRMNIIDASYKKEDIKFKEKKICVNLFYCIFLFFLPINITSFCIIRYKIIAILSITK